MNYSLPKKRHCSSFDNDIPGLPRKRFVSEESFAKDMAAMSLDPDQPVPIQHIFADTEMVLDMHGKPIIDIDQNGLPIEIRPGDNKPRIPQFVLQNPELSDPRDKLAYERMLKSLQDKHTQKYIEVLNNPSDHYTPTSMDVD